MKETRWKHSVRNAISLKEWWTFTIKRIETSAWPRACFPARAAPRKVAQILMNAKESERDGRR